MKRGTINAIVWVLSLVVVAAVALLYITPRIELGMDVSFLPLVHACINGTVALLLLLGRWWIRQGKRNAHRWSMVSAFALSGLFLVSYVTYHSASDPTTFGGEGVMRWVYYLVLVSHIILAALILPLILFTMARALNGSFARHRKLARITWPLWLYVSVTGVLVYLMISPYY